MWGASKKVEKMYFVLVTHTDRQKKSPIEVRVSLDVSLVYKEHSLSKPPSSSLE